MNSNQDSSKKFSNDPTAFTGWGAFIGAAIGLLIGLFTRHWLGWTLGLGFVGWLVGAIVDRSRR